MYWRNMGPPPHVSGYFWIRNFFIPDWKIFPFARNRIKIEFACPHTSDGTCIRIHSRETRPTRSVTILQHYCSLRDWTRFCCVIGLEIFGFTVHTLSDSLWFFFSLLESGLKNIRICCRFRCMRVYGSRIRKEKVADSKISEYVLTRL